MCIKYCGTNSCKDDCPCGRHDPEIIAQMSTSRRLQEADPEFNMRKRKILNSPITNAKLRTKAQAREQRPEYKERKRQGQLRRYRETPFTEESRRKSSQSHKDRWQQEEIRQMYGASFKKAIAEGRKPGGMELFLSGKNGSYMSLSEERLLPILQIFGFENNNIADNKLTLNKRIPDFWDGADQVIEMFGCYWHGCYECFPDDSQVPYRDNPQNRVDFLNSFGYDCLIIWEHDISNVEYIQTLVREYVL